MKNRLSSLVIVLTLLGGACAASGEPDDYDEAVRDNFIEACVASGEQTQQLEAALMSTCTCAYDKFEADVPYDEFKAFDNALREDIDTPFPEEYTEFFADCIRESA